MARERSESRESRVPTGLSDIDGLVGRISGRRVPTGFWPLTTTNCPICRTNGFGTCPKCLRAAELRTATARQKICPSHSPHRSQETVRKLTHRGVNRLANAKPNLAWDHPGKTTGAPRGFPLRDDARPLPRITCPRIDGAGATRGWRVLDAAGARATPTRPRGQRRLTQGRAGQGGVRLDQPRRPPSVAVLPCPGG